MLLHGSYVQLLHAWNFESQATLALRALYPRLLPASSKVNYIWSGSTIHKRENPKRSCHEKVSVFWRGTLFKFLIKLICIRSRLAHTYRLPEHTEIGSQ